MEQRLGFTHTDRKQCVCVCVCVCHLKIATRQEGSTRNPKECPESRHTGTRTESAATTKAGLTMLGWILGTGTLSGRQVQHGRDRAGLDLPACKAWLGHTILASASGIHWG